MSYKEGDDKMSLTDDIVGQLMNKTENELPRLLKNGALAASTFTEGSKNVMKTTVSSTVSGIALVFKASQFTSKTIMQATGQMLKNPKYYKNNISISELEKNSDIRQVDINLTKTEMKYFDKACRKFGVKYNAVVDRSDPKEPTYYVFFRGKDTAVVEKAMKETYETFLKEQAKPKLSVRAKLAFFRDRVKDRDNEQQELGKEKYVHKSEQQR